MKCSKTDPSSSIPPPERDPYSPFLTLVMGNSRVTLLALWTWALEETALSQANACKWEE